MTIRKVKRKGKTQYCVFSKSTGRNLGCSPTRKEALKRERQIQFFKHKKKWGKDMTEIKYMDVKEFYEFGYLQELNRQFLHPLGLALEVVVDENGEYSLGKIQDYRDILEGIIFDENVLDSSKTMRVFSEWSEREVPRVREFGFIFQPVQRE